MNRFSIKKIKRSEVEKISLAFKKALDKDFLYYPSEIREKFKKIWDTKFFKKKESYVLLARSKEGKIIGYLIAQKPWTNSGVVMISWLWVDKNWRNLGVASKLLKITESHFKKTGVHKITLWADNPKSYYFYKKVGYQKEGTERNHFWHLNHIIYAKFL